ncbi:MAG: sigma 54-interacting transcriptional regulator [Gemmataceae bacterium]
MTAETGECFPPALELIPGTPATIGRSRDNTIVLKDDLSSRLHAKIYCDNGRWYVRDFGLNGTKLNGIKINGSTEVFDGGSIQIGETRFRFENKETRVVEDAMDTKLLRKSNESGRQSVRPYSNRNPGARSGVHELQVNRPLVAPSSGVIPPPYPQNHNHHANARAHDGTKVMSVPHDRDQKSPASNEDVHAANLKLDELTSLCRFVADAVSAPNTYAAAKLALEAILRQTTARAVGYLSLEPSDPTPKLVLPELAKVDVPLSRKLTERVRATGKMVWLFAESGANDATESLSAYADAVCLPLGGSSGPPFAALHVYRTGLCFSERDVRFIEAVGGHLAKTVELHRHRRALEAENVRLRTSAPVADDLIGDSDAIASLRLQISKAAPLPINVLISGESGSGKELVAQALHRNSNRGEGPFVVVNCAAIAPTLLEAELFGYKKGAFSGADRDHPGLFEQADEGTLFLDEVGELSLECQAKLLRVIEGKPFRPVGGVADVKVDVRVIAATHRDLEKEVKANRFRQDLLFRLKVIPIRVPPLREHVSDITDLARFFLDRIGIQCRRSFRLTPAAIDKLEAFSWPGNVRQLRAVLESTAVLSEGDLIEAEQLPLALPVEAEAPTSDFPSSLDVEELETWAIRKSLVKTSGNVSQAARLLGISRDTLHTKIKKKGIDRGEPLALAEQV